MALYEIPVFENIIDVAFNNDTSSIAVLHHGGVALYTWAIAPASSSSPTLNARFTFKSDSKNFYQHICFNEKNEILTLQHTVHDTSIVTSYCFDDETGGMKQKNVQSLSVAAAILLSSNENGTLHPFVQEISGKLSSLVEIDALKSVAFPTVLPLVETIQFGENRIAFGLSSNGHLYANGRTLAKNCTSFILTPAHLIFTTTTHLLKFVHITGVEG